MTDKTDLPVGEAGSATDTGSPPTDLQARLAVAWNLLVAPGVVSGATYLTVANAKQYRLIIDVLADEQSHRLTGVGHDELPELLQSRLARDHGEARAADLLSVEVFPLEQRMRQLVHWGTCESWQDQARTEADFLRNRERYQLTEVGAQVNRLARELDAGLGSASTAAVLAPPILAEQLRRIREALAAGDTEAAATSFVLVQTTLADMARTSATWQSRLAAALGGAPDEAKVARLLETIVDYVEMWGAGVDLHSERIADSSRHLSRLGKDQWRSLAFPRVGAGADEAAIDVVVAELADTVATLLLWFDGPSAQSTRLRRQIRDAVTPLLRGHRALLAVGGVVSRRADLLRVAAALERAPDDVAAWRVWSEATGLYAARHLGLLAPDIHQSSQISVWDAPPIPIERRLRTQGSRALAGRAARIVDTSLQRAAARARAAAQRVRDAEAEAALAARSGALLSEIGALAQGEADLLLDLVSSARSRPAAADGSRHGVSADGRWRIRLQPIVPPCSAVVHLPSGRLVLSDARMAVDR